MACVRKRRGRWVVDFRDRDGNRRWESYRTRKEADEALSGRVRELKRGTYRPPTEIPTFEKVALGWLATKTDRRPASVGQWECHVHSHLIPAFGPTRLDQLAVADVEWFRDSKRTDGLGPATVNKILTTGSAVYKFVARHNLAERNPFAVAERARIDAGEVQPQEAYRLIQHAEPGLHRTLLMTAILTGARVGELTGLTWSDLDLDAGKLWIRRSLSWSKTRDEGKEPRPRFFEPKTKASRRTIPLPAELVSVLKLWKLQCPPGPLNLVFPTPNGGPLHRKSVHGKTLGPALARAKLRHVTTHSLRHSFASALIMQGTPITEVSHLLGHLSPQVTLTVYSHWFKELKTASVETLAKTVLGTSGSKVVADQA